MLKITRFTAQTIKTIILCLSPTTTCLDRERDIKMVKLDCGEKRRQSTATRKLSYRMAGNSQCRIH